MISSLVRRNIDVKPKVRVYCKCFFKTIFFLVPRFYIRNSPALFTRIGFIILGYILMSISKCLGKYSWISQIYKLLKYIVMRYLNNKKSSSLHQTDIKPTVIYVIDFTNISNYFHNFIQFALSEYEVNEVILCKTLYQCWYQFIFFLSTGMVIMLANPIIQNILIQFYITYQENIFGRSL